MQEESPTGRMASKIIADNDILFMSLFLYPTTKLRKPMK